MIVLLPTSEKHRQKPYQLFKITLERKKKKMIHINLTKLYF